MPSETASSPSKTLSSVDRALALLEILAREGRLNLTELAKRLQSGKPTVFRLAASLIERGWVVKGDDFRYGLGPAALNLAVQRDHGLDLKTRLMPILVELHEETQETVHLSQLEGRYIAYQSQLLSTKAVISLSWGGRLPAHCTSPGMALLAAMPDSYITWFLNKPLQIYNDLSPKNAEDVWEGVENIRKRGYSINRGAYRNDIGGVGVAVLDSGGTPIAGISICIPVFRMEETDIGALGQRLIRAAQEAQLLLKQPVAQVGSY